MIRLDSIRPRTQSTNPFLVIASAIKPFSALGLRLDDSIFPPDLYENGSTMQHARQQLPSLKFFPHRIRARKRLEHNRKAHKAILRYKLYSRSLMCWWINRQTLDRTMAAGRNPRNLSGLLRFFFRWTQKVEMFFIRFDYKAIYGFHLLLTLNSYFYIKVSGKELHLI